MASIQPRSGKFQLRVVHKLLPKPFFWTFDIEQEARDYGVKLEAMLAKGIVPAEMHVSAPGDKRDTTPLTKLMTEYEANAPITSSDSDLFVTLAKDVVGVKACDVTYLWVEEYVQRLKVEKNLAPGSIRKRVGALARVLDWHHRRTTGRDQVNPFRLLPVGYSSYSKADTAKVSAKFDVARDRRLLPAEEAAVRLALSGVKAEGKQRSLVPDADLELLFDLLLDTGLRLSEAFRLRGSQVDLVRGVLRVEGSKGHRGAAKPRVVPLKPVLRERLKGRELGGLLFPFWDGTAEGLRKATSKLSVRFGVLFDYAGVKDFTAHDLRHEAACRWFELRDREGRWTLSDVEVARVMGWASLDMALRYASIRGEDLVARLA